MFYKALVLGLMLSFSVSSSAEEVLDYSEIRECVQISYKLEQRIQENDARSAWLTETRREINRLDSRLKELHWDYKMADNAVQNCHIMNNHNCYAQENHLNNIVNRYNGIVDRHEKLRRNYNREAERHKHKVDYAVNLSDRFGRQCYNKKFRASDIRRACSGENTPFCNEFDL